MTDAELPFTVATETVADTTKQVPAFVAVCDRCGEKVPGETQADARDRLDYHRGGHMMLFRDLDDLTDRIGTLERTVRTLQHQLDGTTP